MIVTTSAPHITYNKAWTITPKPVAKREPYQWTVERDGLKAVQLIWWTIRGYQSCEFERSRDAMFERRGWVGLNVSNMSETEYRAIKKWGERGCVYVSRRHGDCEESFVTEWIGEYKDYCLTCWFADPRYRDEFIAFLEAFPKRDAALLVKDMKKVLPYLRGTNFHFLRGAMGSLVGITPEIDEHNRFLLRLSV